MALEKQSAFRTSSNPVDAIGAEKFTLTRRRHVLRSGSTIVAQSVGNGSETHSPAGYAIFRPDEGRS
jgi:hypothetical protein